MASRPSLLDAPADAIRFDKRRLSSFPQPNPFFPPPPRKDKLWTWRGVIIFSLMFVASLTALISLALHSEDISLPDAAVVVIVIISIVSLLLGALGAPLAAYNAWRMHPWRYGEIVPGRVVRPRPRGGMFEVLCHLMIHFIPIIGYFVWLVTGGSSAKVAFIRAGRRHVCKAVCDDAGPEAGQTVWIVRPRIFFPARILAYAAPDPWASESPPPDVVEWLDLTLAAADKKYSHMGQEYTKRI